MSEDLYDGRTSDGYDEDYDFYDSERDQYYRSGSIPHWEKRDFHQAGQVDKSVPEHPGSSARYRSGANSTHSQQKQNNSDAGSSTTTRENGINGWLIIIGGLAIWILFSYHYQESQKSNWCKVERHGFTRYELCQK